MPATQPHQIARLALRDGAVFTGRAFGATDAPRTVEAEVVFNTALCGYQEALTDPSYARQILVMTTPMMGIYGANEEDVESAKIQVDGFVVRELVETPSNQRAIQSLSDYLKRHGTLGLTDVDTRAITRRLRRAGAMPGVISNDPSLSDADLVARARSAPDMSGQDLTPLVACSTLSAWDESLGEWAPRRTSGASGEKPLRVLALDCGAKRNILRHLVERNCIVTLAPPGMSAAEVRDAFEQGRYDGLFISNGPGDPAAVQATIATLKELMTGPAEATPPTFGICLGCQLLALSIGAKTYKLKFGHRGINQPVRNNLAERIEITSQNHGFAVDADSLRAAGGEPTHLHLNDATIAGFRLVDRPVFAVQHHPEASPGPHDSNYLFDAFIRMMRERRPVDAAMMSSTA
ncbi:MAG: glutamine-hydrolyzing carbamoyl-phosphate synthase small subunit [Planctomycetota bacterium]|nr:glutamine-hydrolyzing carbamoyl-phosphate synthase small subunit [Planctomycetota bacterium]